MLTSNAPFPVCAVLEALAQLSIDVHLYSERINETEFVEIEGPGYSPKTVTAHRIDDDHEIVIFKTARFPVRKTIDTPVKGYFAKHNGKLIATGQLDKPWKLEPAGDEFGLSAVIEPNEKRNLRVEVEATHAPG